MLSTAMYLLLNILILALVKAHHPESCERCSHDDAESWSYRGEMNGPEKWGNTYDQCNGQKQSPIDIVTSHVNKTVDDENRIEFENYDKPITHPIIKNDGYSVKLENGDGVIRTITVEGKTYKFCQLHFHWGCDEWSNNGSEHTVDGQSYPLEMHLVHKAGECDDPNADAAVLTVFFGWFFWIPHFELQIFVNSLHDIHYKDQETELNSCLTLSHLLPWWNTRSYYSYEGSLTTPPCTEGVRFFIFTNPTVVAPWQLEEFRSLHSAPKGETDAPGCKLCGNNRPTQPLNGRPPVSLYE